MGTSYVELDEYGFWCNDGLVELWFLCVVREINNLSQPSGWLRKLQDEWLVTSTIGSSGCIAANLTKYASNNNNRGVLLQLNKNALIRLDAPEDKLEKDYYVVPAHKASHVLEGWLSDEINSLHPDAKHNLRMTGLQFVKLLRGEWSHSNPAEETRSWCECFRYP